MKWSLVGGNGAIVSPLAFSASDVSLASPVLQVPAGNYSLIISGDGSAPDYQFRLLDLDGSSQISPGERFAGTLGPRNETDVYQFEAQQGNVFEFVAVG